MKKSVALLVIILLTLSLFAACSSEDSDVPKNQQPNINQGESTSSTSTPDMDDDMEVLDADAWWLDLYYSFEAHLMQGEDFGLTNPDVAGMYAYYEFDIKMIGGSSAGVVATEEGYGIFVESSIKVNTDELADRLLSEKLGVQMSGMGLGVDVEMIGKYQSLAPYYIDDNGYPVCPDRDVLTGEYLWPEGKKDDATGFAYFQKVRSNWNSPIKDKNGKPVSPTTGSYLMFDTFKMDYSETASGGILDILHGNSVSVDSQYDAYLFILLDPTAGGMKKGNYKAKVYLSLITLNNHQIWIEGEGMLSLAIDAYPKPAN